MSGEGNARDGCALEPAQAADPGRPRTWVRPCVVITMIIVSLPMRGWVSSCRHLPLARAHMPCDVMGTGTGTGTGSYVISRQPEVCGLGSATR